MRPAKLEQSMKLGILVQFLMLDNIGRGSHLTNAPVATNCSNFVHILLQTAIEAKIHAAVSYNLGVSTLGHSTTSW